MSKRRGQGSQADAIREALLAQLGTPHAYLHYASIAVAAALRVPMEDVERQWQPLLDEGAILYTDGVYTARPAP